ncbi:ABC transporter permease [Brevundimonas bullata]|uniref:ABC transporter permease n=1 Tax=Brevundimonas bullata TaxID=13160 RepID=UPI003D9AA163
MTDAPAIAVAKSRAPWPLSLIVGGVLTAVVVVTALIAFVWTPYDVEAQNIAAKLTAPSVIHPFGTDHFGRDVLSMIMVGAQNSLAVALVAVGIGAGIGVPLGLTAAAHGGWVDDLVMRGNDLIFAFPALLLAVMITAVMGPGAINAVIAIGLFNIPVFTRVARGAAQTLWAREYILAARTAGKSKALISLQHILPNLMGLLIVQAAIQFAVGIVAEAGLSYVGLGAQPPAPSWGRMLAEAQTMTGFAPWLAVMPGLAIFVTVLGLSLTGDGLRDRLDPRVRERRA